MQRENRFRRVQTPPRPLPEQAAYALERLQSRVEGPTSPTYATLEHWRRELERIMNAIPKAHAETAQENLRDRLFRITTAVQGLQYLLLARPEVEQHPLDPSIRMCRAAVGAMTEGALTHAAAWRERAVHRA